MKTRNQRKREREQAVFVAAMTVWIALLVGLILWKVVM